MTITAEQAQAELDRRAKAKPAGITAEQAQAELDRRASQETDWGPRGLGDNFARAGQSLDDSMRIIVDAASRGYADKLMGPEEQAKTAAARERQGWGGTAVDVGAAVATSPYRIGSMAGGALAGGLEGAASAYGHQEGWVPGVDVLKGAATGAAFGAGGAKLGEWLGGGKATREAEAARPYKTDAELQAAAAVDPSLAQRAANVADIRAAQGSPRDTFAKMMSGMSPEVQAMVPEIAGAKSMTRAAGAIADKTGKQLPPIPLLVVEAALSGGIPYKTLGGMAVRHAVSKAGTAAGKVSDKEIAALADLERSGPRFVDPATIDRWRDMTAKVGIGYGREP